VANEIVFTHVDDRSDGKSRVVPNLSHPERYSSVNQWIVTTARQMEDKEVPIVFIKSKYFPETKAIITSKYAERPQTAPFREHAMRGCFGIWFTRHEDAAYFSAALRTAKYITVFDEAMLWTHVGEYLFPVEYPEIFDEDDETSDEFWEAHKAFVDSLVSLDDRHALRSKLLMIATPPRKVPDRALGPTKPSQSMMNRKQYTSRQLGQC